MPAAKSDDVLVGLGSNRYIGAAMKSVLVIDDCQEVLETIGMVLEDAGFNVVLTMEPERAEKLCREIAFDAVLCDLYLKNRPAEECPSSAITGLDLIFNLINAFPKVPLISMSGALDQNELAKLKKLGVAAFLSKPFKPAELVLKIEDVLGKDSDPEEPLPNHH